MFDVIVIGGGPSGLSATVGSACEGLNTLCLAEELGGQAGHSSLIENFLGFPEGISGAALTDRSRRQALKFGATIMPCAVQGLERDPAGFYRVQCAEGEFRARAVVVATGARYNRLPPSTNFQAFEGKGVHYACTQREVRKSCQCDEVIVVGGGNSAGQAAMFLAGKAKRVHLVIRSGSLKHSMSAYLIARINNTPNIELHPWTEIDKIDGKGRVSTVVLRNNLTGHAQRKKISDVFVMIGAKPNSGFVKDLCALDGHGFIETDDHFETALPGLYAVGDIRSGSTKRVANAVGEGAVCMKHVWAYLNPALEPA